MTFYPLKKAVLFLKDLRPQVPGKAEEDCLRLYGFGLLPSGIRQELSSSVLGQSLRLLALLGSGLNAT